MLVWTAPTNTPTTSNGIIIKETTGVKIKLLTNDILATTWKWITTSGNIQMVIKT